MSPVASVLILAAPMASLATLARLTREKRRKSVLPTPQAPAPPPEMLQLPEAGEASAGWQAAIGGMIGEEDHSTVLAEHFRRGGANAQRPN